MVTIKKDYEDRNDTDKFNNSDPLNSTSTSKKHDKNVEKFSVINEILIFNLCF